MADLGTLWFGSDIDLTTLKQKIQQGNKSILDALKMDYDPQSYQEMIGRLRSSLARETFEIKINANPQGLAQNLRQSLGSNKGLTGGLDELNEKILAQTEAVNRLKAKLESLRATYANQRRAGQYLQLGNTGNSIADVRRELALEKQTLADFIAQRNTLRNATKDTMLNLRREAMEHKNTATAAGQSLRQRRDAVRQLNSDHLRLNTTLAGGVHVSKHLGSALSTLFAVHTARTFLSYVIEIGGQLEKQRISIGAILGDTVKANHLFEQIKGLALQSPFGVVELDQYTKQLSAYGFKYSELFDMTERLADISAGAGTDIGRLTLALGHVRSATYLTGIALRQFSMNNIPMLKMLADYYSEVEKHAVTTSEVQKRISKRQVSYEDVIEQIRRLTNEGGMFYNMQEKISESLAARYKNLKDAMDIMYGEMAEGEVGDILKELASVLLKTTRHWKEIANVVGVAATAFALSKLRIGASTIAMQSNTAATVKNIIADKQLTASKIRQMGITRSLTTVEKAALITSNQLRVADLRQALASGALTKEEALRLVTLKRIKIAQAMHLAGVNGITAAEIRAAVAANRWSVALKGVGVSLRNAFMGVGAGTWATLGAMVGMEIYSAYSSWVDRIDDKTKEMKDLIKSRIIDLQKQQKIIVGGEKPKDTVELQNRVDEMKQVLANSEAYTKTLDEQLGKAGGINEQYDILVGAIDRAVEKNRQLLTYQDEIGEAIKMSSGDFMSTSFDENLRWFFNDDINKNMSQTLDAYKDLRKVIEGAWEYKDAIKGVIDEMITAGEISEGFAEQLKNAPFEEQIRLLAESGYWDTIVGRVIAINADFAGFADKLKDASNGVTERWDEIASDDIPRMMKQIAKERNISEEELKTWALNNIDDFKMMLDGISNQLDIKEPAVRKRLKKLFYDYVRFSELEKGLAEGAEIGASVFGDIYQTLLDEDEKADIKDDKKGGKGKTGGSSKDAQLEAAKTRLAEYKAFLSEYKKYAEKYDKQSAINILEKLFPNLKGKGESLVDNYEVMLDELRGSLSLTTEARKKFANEIDKTKADTLFDRDTEAMKRNAKAMADYADRLEEQWKRYRSLYKKSGGNKEFASMAFKDGEIWDETSRNLLARFNERGKELGVIPVGFRWDMNENEMRDSLRDAKGRVQEELVDLAKRIQKIIHGNYTQFLEDSADGLSKSLSAAQELVALEEKRQRLIGEKKAYNGTDENIRKGYDAQIAGVEKEIQSKRWEAFKETEQWGRIFSNLDNITTSTLENMLAKLRMMAPAINEDTQSVKALYEAMDKIEGTLTSRNPFSAISSSLSNASALRKYSKQAGTKGDLVANTELARLLRVAVGSRVTKAQIDDETRKQMGKFGEGLGGLVDKFNAVTDVLHPVIDLFDQLGMTEVGDFLNMGGNALGAAAQTASGLNALGLGAAAPYGAVAAAGVSIISGLFSMQDAALQEEIDASKARQKEMDNLTKNLEKVLERTLGGVYQTENSEADRRKLEEYRVRYKTKGMFADFFGNMTDEMRKAYKDIDNVFKKAQQTDSYYDTQLAFLYAQRYELNRQLSAEQDKKSPDDSAIADYKQQLDELNDEIKNFAADMANALYDIDIKSWAAELGDALYQAWQKGESGAEAFKKKAAEILADVAKNIAVVKLVETSLKPVLDIITDEMDRKSGKLDAESLSRIADATAVVGGSLPESFNNLMDALDQGFQKAGLGSMKDLADEGGSGSVTGGIKSITENTADLLASYINAIRADVSVNRIAISASLPAITSAVQRTSVLAEAQVTLQTQIAQNTQRSAEAAEAIQNILRLATIDRSHALYMQ